MNTLIFLDPYVPLINLVQNHPKTIRILEEWIWVHFSAKKSWKDPVRKNILNSFQNQSRSQILPKPEIGVIEG